MKNTNSISKSVSFLCDLTTNSNCSLLESGMEQLERSIFRTKKPTMRSNSKSSPRSPALRSAPQNLHKPDSHKSTLLMNNRIHTRMEEKTFKKVIESAIQPLHKEIRSLMQVIEKLQSEISVLKCGGVVPSCVVVPNNNNNPTVNYSAMPRPITYEQPSTSSATLATPPEPVSKDSTKKTKTKKKADTAHMKLEPISEDNIEPVKQKSSWNVAKSRKKKKKPTSAKKEVVDNDQQTADSNQRTKYILASAFRKNVTKPCIFKFLKKIYKNYDEYEVEQIEANHYHNAFSIGVPERLFSTFIDPTIWPKGVKISEWFPPAPAIHEPLVGASSTMTTMLALTKAPHPK